VPLCLGGNPARAVCTTSKLQVIVNTDFRPAHARRLPQRYVYRTYEIALAAQTR
jgi:hypothetical protein